MLKLHITLFFAILLTTNIQAQTKNQKHDETKALGSPILSLNIPFNSGEMSIGGSLYLPLLFQYKYNVSLMISLYARPFAKKELIKQTNDSYNLYREYRHHIDIGIQNNFKIYRDLSVFTSLALGIMGVYRRGSNTDFWEFVVPIFDIGVCIPTVLDQKNSYQLRLGYQYLATDTYKGNYVYIAFVLLFAGQES